MRHNPSWERPAHQLCIFSQLPTDLLHLVLEFDGKIISPKMDAQRQSNIINYLKNAYKSIKFILNYKYYTGPSLDMLLYGSHFPSLEMV